jgi:hypothetical protein
MAAELLFNDPGTTLASAITSTGATSISVTSSTGYPSTGNFRILIDSELMLVTAISGTTWTVTRGVESTTATTHLISAAVNHIFTGAAFTAIRSNMSGLGTYSSLPATSASTAGDKYILSDGNLEYIYDGSNWQPFVSSRQGTANALMPSSGSFTVNGSGNSISNSKGCLLALAPTSNAWGTFMQSVPGTPYSIEVGFTFLSAPGAAAGVCVGDGTKYEYWVYGANQIDIQYNTALNSFGSTLLGPGNMYAGSPLFMKITVDSSHKTYYMGDGINYVQQYQEAATTNLTATVAGLVMLGSSSSGAVPMMNVYYYKLG